MNENRVGGNVLVNITQCCIYNLCGYVIDIVGVNQIENQTAWPPGNQIFGVVFRCGSPGVAQRAPVIRVFAGVNNKPSALSANSDFIGLRANK